MIKIKKAIKKNLIYCGNCEKSGKREVLGEVGDMGNFIIMRFHKGSTIVIGDSFLIKCGVCQEETFYRDYRNEIKNDFSNKRD